MFSCPSGKSTCFWGTTKPKSWSFWKENWLNKLCFQMTSHLIFQSPVLIIHMKPLQEQSFIKWLDDTSSHENILISSPDERLFCFTEGPRNRVRMRILILVLHNVCYATSVNSLCLSEASLTHMQNEWVCLKRCWVITHAKNND